MQSSSGKRKTSFYLLAAFFALFVLFLYGPMLSIFILSFQGPQGGMTFPLRGVSRRIGSAISSPARAMAIWAAPFAAR